MLGALGLLPDSAEGHGGAARREPARVQPHRLQYPGPRFPVYMLGAELSEAYPGRPVAEGHALSIGMFSYRDHMFFGLYSDPEALPEADRLPALLDGEILALASGAPLTRQHTGGFAAAC